MATKGQNGADFLISVNIGTVASPVYSVVGGQRDLTVDQASDAIDVSSKDTPHAEFIAGRRSKTVQFDALFIPNAAAYGRLAEAQENGELVRVRRKDFGQPVKEAEGIVTSLSESFPDQGAATVSCNIQISGTFTAV